MLTNAAKRIGDNKALLTMSDTVKLVAGIWGFHHQIRAAPTKPSIPLKMKDFIFVFTPFINLIESVCFIFWDL